ncbi:MAG: pilus assembly protein [Sphingomonadales bacterium]|nr:pilus assembly protein [Sphingomonadales bacterium]
MSRNRRPRALPVPAARLCAAEAGNAVIEFAVILPVFLMLIFGILDFGQMMYGQVLINGATRQAARNSTVEGADTTAADTMVRNVVRTALPGATVSLTRTTYADFSDIGRAEKFTDSNANGTCDRGEPYTDENGNGHWDADIGVTGNGTADSVVVYKATAQYRPLFRIPFMPNQWSSFTLGAAAVRKNQPWATQTAYGTATGTC